MAWAVADEVRTLEKLYQNGLLGGAANRKRPPILEDLRLVDLT